MRKKRTAASAAIKTIIFFLCLGALGLVIMLRASAVPEAGPAVPSGTPSSAAVHTTPGPEAVSATAEPELPPDYSGLLQITELMSKNRSVVLSNDGIFCDWVEIRNVSDGDVSLSGWYVNNTGGSDGFLLGDAVLGPDEYCVVFTGDSGHGSSFTFKTGETVYLADPNAEVQDSVLYLPEDKNTGYALNADGLFAETAHATPGFDNTAEGYELYMQSRTAEGPLVISEATVSNRSYAVQTNGAYSDWIELRNISSAPVQLSGYYLSDSRKDYLLYQLPEVELGPGEYYLVWCGDDLEDADHTGFGLNTYNEDLFLSDSTHVIDYVYLHDVPVNGSCGRMPDAEGFFYFDTPTPLAANENGGRFVLGSPAVSIPAGTYDGVENVTVELSGDGTIYYTTDGTVPTRSSSVYSEPLVISKNTVIRTFSARDGFASSRVANYTYLINENVSLPVLSLVVDNLPTFNAVYNAKNKKAELSANLTLYDTGDTVFSANCGVSLAGWTSLDNAKKSFNIDFRSRYGDSMLTGVDIFENGISEYDKLCIRTGQDHMFAVIRNELCQDLAMELPDSHILTQASKYCILYINGEYRGIYALKENICDQFYAAHYGFDEDTVTSLHAPVSLTSDYYYEVLSFIYNNDLSVDENYEYLCSVMDIDNLIDWVIMEGWCANTDTISNLRYFKSTEDGKWRVAFYDLDWSFWYSHSDFVNVYSGVGNDGQQMTTLLNRLLRSKPFREKFLTRFAECISTTLSNENVLAKIEELYNLVEPEVQRDHNRWYLVTRYFYERIDELKTFITYNGWDKRCIETVCILYGISESYFETNYLNNVQTAS